MWYVCLGDSVTPTNNTTLVLNSSRNEACLFKYDKECQEIVHKSGLVWYPSGGGTRVADHTSCVLHSNRDDSSKFYFGDRYRNLLDAVRPCSNN